MLQPPASVRPVMLKRACTPPSRIVLVGGLAYLNLASRIGPLGVTKAGTTFVAPSLVAIATWGLTAGLEPPTAGCIWHPAQLSRLNRGPRPASVPAITPVTEPTSSKASSPR